MNVNEITKWSKVKGLNLVGTGDMTHPIWLKQLKEELSQSSEGVYEYDRMKFILTGEISLIYTDKKQRRVHLLLHAPSFDVVDQMNEWLDKKGRRDYDGRPIFGFSCIEFIEAMMRISNDIEIIPAHAWTPWYSLFGSMSGFDSLKECFGDQTKHVHAIETGMSSDPAMNWRLSQLDEITLVSNSDSHSPYPWRLGREANVFDLKEEFSYKDVIDAIRTRKNFLFTIETPPEYGKYHIDGHRTCSFSSSPEETKKHKGLCPKCEKKLVIGVLNRVEELADRPEGYRPKNAVDFKRLLPLHELISYSLNASIETKKAWDVYNRLIDAFGNEFFILLESEKKDMEKHIDERLVSLILKNREGRIKIIPGYDGVYGKIDTSYDLKKFFAK
ncbi:MAG: endonuclease Q family protein [Candidatus Aenigmarchaeota archaeon]|nr:endonuclease Q family protein [Candidatus Aenigmarchaeota archaeon]